MKCGTDTYLPFNNTGQQNLKSFLTHEEKYLILIEILTLNSNVQVVFLHHPQFVCDSQVNPLPSLTFQTKRSGFK
jgi:hypothetical protein